MSAFLEEQRELAYRTYVTDSLKYLTENTSRIAGGTSMTKRFCEAMDELTKPKKVETRTADEIIDSISDKLNKLGGE